ncbi:MAG TPA: glutamate 5-kinase, partial [Bacillota bacterium]|nr:glutamate 5-kinase [Bacillota bacterium]
MIRTDFRPETAQRIVVKVGTRLLTHETGQLNLAYIERLVRELADLKNQGRQVILVSSGAVGAGMGRLGLKRRPDTIPELQAA